VVLSDKRVISFNFPMALGIRKWALFMIYSFDSFSYKSITNAIEYLGRKKKDGDCNYYK